MIPIKMLFELMPRMIKWSGLPILSAVIGIGLQAAETGVSDNPEGLELYRKSIKPLFQKHCVDCHGGSKTKGGLDLTKRINLMQGGDSGPVVVVGDHKASLLFETIAHTVEQKMPYKKPKLHPDEIQQIGRWIDLGTVYSPEDLGTSADLAKKPMEITEKDRAFWSFGPLDKVHPPKVGNEDWSANPIDQFLFSAMNGAGLKPELEASRETLLRRVSFGLLGLPPSPDEMKAFLVDKDPDAYGKQIDRLLNSDHFGERWGRHWLDLARFGESHGYEADNDRANAYSYRDAVIKALNKDIPYDQFIKWQLAGDEYAPDDLLAVTLTGFISAGPLITNEGGDRVKWDKLDDIVSATGEAMLGLTIGCARCHDHKYDPITAKDYYGLAGIFANHKIHDVSLLSKEDQNAFETKRDALRKKAEEAKKRHEDWFKQKESSIVKENIEKNIMLSDKQKKLLIDLEKAKEPEWGELRKKYDLLFRVNRKELAKSFSEEVREEEQELRKEMDRLSKEHREFKPPNNSKGMVVTDHNKARPQAFFLDRGDWRSKTKMDYQFVEVLMPTSHSTGKWLMDTPKEAKTSHSRRALAEWMTDTQEGAGRLLARVIVNRIWQHHFGKGIVKTSSNFGAQGAQPSHPELLDWLALDLVRNGWSLKRVHKKILMSAAYRQATTSKKEKLKKDPTNQYLSYRSPVRLEAEIIRDSILAVSGMLNRQMFGQSIKPWIHTDAITTGSTRKWPMNVKDGPNTWRRSIYIYAKRSMLMPMMQAFDLPDSTRSCAVRNTTTVAPAALLMLNNEFIREQSRHLAMRVSEEAGISPGDQVMKLYQIAFSRMATRDEVKLGIEFMDRQARTYAGEPDKVIADGHRMDALTNYCQAIIALNEFIYIH
jgi:mono/diheme cytochrome c family protein